MDASHHEPNVNLTGPHGEGRNELFPSAESSTSEALRGYGRGVTMLGSHISKDGHPEDTLSSKATTSRSHPIHFSVRRGQRSSLSSSVVSNSFSYC